jgi:hypothetical protein
VLAEYTAAAAILALMSAATCGDPEPTAGAGGRATAGDLQVAYGRVVVADASAPRGRLAGQRARPARPHRRRGPICIGRQPGELHAC